MKRAGDKANKVIVMPEYAMDQRLKVMREVNHPSDKIFIGLGYDDDDTTKRKHYRQFHPDELEFKQDLFSKPSPFDTYNLRIGQSRGLQSGGLFSTKKKKASTIKKVGYFKGLIQIESVPARKDYLADRKKIIDTLKE